MNCLLIFLKIEGSLMDYSIVSLVTEIKISGLKTLSLNLTHADQSLHIAHAWKRFFELNLANTGNIFGVYTDYDQNMNYSMIIGSEFKNNDAYLSGLIDFVIPAGKYAVFTVEGKMSESISKFWGDLWTNINNFPFERTFRADFELYDERYFKPVPIIDVYISIK